MFICGGSENPSGNGLASVSKDLLEADTSFLADMESLSTTATFLICLPFFFGFDTVLGGGVCIPDEAEAAVPEVSPF